MSLDTTLWLACDVADAAVIALLLYRSLWREFPVFFLYVAWALIGDVVGEIVLRNDHSGYATWYLAATIGDSILLFSVLVELGWSILRPLRASLSRRALVPVIGLILIAGAAVWPLASLSRLADASGQEHYIVQLQQTVSILQVIFFLVLIASGQVLSIGWRDRELQVATGLGFFSFVSIATALLRAHQTSYIQYKHLFRIEIGAYICSLVYWAVCFAQKDAERRKFTPEMQRLLLAVAGAAHSTRASLADSQTGQPLESDRR
ncbi:MAG: hypothetical protein ABSD59_12915 [Terracidiphilus sp.]